MVTTSALGANLGRVFAINCVLKLFTFSITVVLTRQLVPSVKGVGFAFTLYVACIGFLAREAPRAAAARLSLAGERDVHRVASVGLLTLLLFVVLMPLFVLHCAFLQPEEFRMLCTPAVVAMFVVGTGLELLSEPVQLLWSSMLFLQSNIVADALGVMGRLIVTTAAVFHFAGQNGGVVSKSDAAVAYAFGHLCGCSLILAFHLVSIRRWAAKPHKAQLEKQVALGWRTMNLSKLITGVPLFLSSPVSKGQATGLALLWQFGSESALRLVVTEGEKFVLAARGSFELQGVYDLVAGLGSVLVRILFSVWERFAFQAWSRDEGGATVSDAKWELLHVMVRLAFTFGALSVSFGPIFSGVFIDTLFGKSWSHAAGVLVVYCYYLPLLGINGLGEAFVRATGTVAVLRRAKVAAIVCSGLYISACYTVLFILNGGIVSLVLVNCANMTIRIVVAFTLTATGVASGKAPSVWLPPVFPRKTALVVYAASYAAARLLPIGFVPVFIVASLAAAVNDNVWLRALGVNIGRRLGLVKF